jgi:alkylation response protein AidB-like acyl-CoA dehydrogenase
MLMNIHTSAIEISEVPELTPQLTEVHEFEELLTPESLSALMRSTWTWDDRALRRDLAALLVGLDAAQSAAANDQTADHAETLRARALASASEFVADVLGPGLIADAGNPMRAQFAADAANPARFVRDASSALTRVRERTAQYVTRQAGAVDYPSESTWLTLLTANGHEGLASSMRAYGFGMSTSSYFASAGLAWQTLRAVGEDFEHAAEYAKAIETGAVSATLAAAEQSGSWDPALVRTKAVRGAAGWQLSGAKLFVPAAEDADLILVFARSIAGPSLFAVEGSAPGLQVTPLSVIDETRPLYRIELGDTPAVLVSPEGHGGRVMMTAIDLACTALAAEQIGLIEKAMQLLAPATESQQLAEVTLHHVTAVALWRRALAEQAAGSTGFPASASAAHIGCSQAAVRAATTAAELLGSSEDTDALQRRALSANLLFGGPALSYERLLERLGV